MSTAFSDATRRRLTNEFIVYRMFDSSGILLYIGRTSNSGRRFNEHSSKGWFSLVATITLERYSSATRAEDAERLAILAEKPAFNVYGTDPRPRVPQPRFRRGGLPFDSVAIPDVLRIFGSDRQLHWQTIAERLTVTYPDRWSGATAAMISAKFRALGVPSVSIREPGSCVRNGCRRAAIEDVATH